MTLWSLQRICLTGMELLLCRGNGRPARAFQWWGSLGMWGSALSLFYYIYPTCRRVLQHCRYNLWLINGMRRRPSMLLRLLPQYLSYNWDASAQRMAVYGKFILRSWLTRSFGCRCTLMQGYMSGLMLTIVSRLYVIMGSIRDQATTRLSSSMRHRRGAAMIGVLLTR